MQEFAPTSASSIYNSARALCVYIAVTYIANIFKLCSTNLYWSEFFAYAATSSVCV